MNEFLSQSEIRACEVIQNQTDDQLQYTADTFTNDQTFDFVDYMLIDQNRIAFAVKKDFFILSILFELNYRGLV